MAPRNTLSVLFAEKSKARYGLAYGGHLPSGWPLAVGVFILCCCAMGFRSALNTFGAEEIDAVLPATTPAPGSEGRADISKRQEHNNMLAVGKGRVFKDKKHAKQSDQKKPRKAKSGSADAERAVIDQELLLESRLLAQEQQFLNKEHKLAQGENLLLEKERKQLHMEEKIAKGKFRKAQNQPRRMEKIERRFKQQDEKFWQQSKEWSTLGDEQEKQEAVFKKVDSTWPANGDASHFPELTHRHEDLLKRHDKILSEVASLKRRNKELARQQEVLQGMHKDVTRQKNELKEIAAAEQQKSKESKGDALGHT